MDSTSFQEVFALRILGDLCCPPICTPTRIHTADAWRQRKALKASPLKEKT